MLIYLFFCFWYLCIFDKVIFDRPWPAWPCYKFHGLDRSSSPLEDLNASLTPAALAEPDVVDDISGRHSSTCRARRCRRCSGQHSSRRTTLSSKRHSLRAATWWRFRGIFISVLNASARSYLNTQGRRARIGRRWALPTLDSNWCFVSSFRQDVDDYPPQSFAEAHTQSLQVQAAHHWLHNQLPKWPSIRRRISSAASIPENNKLPVIIAHVEVHHHGAQLHFCHTVFLMMRWYIRSHSSSGILHAWSSVTNWALRTPRATKAYTVTLLRYCCQAETCGEAAAGPCMTDNRKSSPLPALKASQPASSLSAVEWVTNGWTVVCQLMTRPPKKMAMPCMLRPLEPVPKPMSENTSSNFTLREILSWPRSSQIFSGALLG